MTEKRYDRTFGDGTFLGDNGFIGVRPMGWSHACPVVDNVVQEFGPKWTLKRYAECNFWHGVIIEAVKHLNPSLHEQLTKSVSRLPEEKPGKGYYNPNLVPASFYTEMSPLSTPWGYALPRVIIEEMGRGENNKDRNEKRMKEALAIMEKQVKTAETPIDLLVKIAEAVSKSKANPKAVLSHVLSADLLHEQGCQSTFYKIKQKIDKSAPVLRKAYDSMSPNERTSEGIINF